MATISYTPAFQHDDWIDNVDRVQAGGSNGINIRFHRLEVEFQALAAVIGQVATTLDAINATLATLTLKPPPQDLNASISPVLAPTSGSPWASALGRVEKSPAVTGAHGWMGITLPDRAYLNGMTVFGRNTGAGNIAVKLQRQSILGTSPNPETLLEVDSSGHADPFTGTTAHGGPIDTKYIVDNQNFKYLLIADLDNAAGNDAVAITNIQVAYTVGKPGV